MIQPPTDKLYKFMAVAGIALVIFGITYPIDRYHDAELSRIDAIEKAQIYANSYEQYAAKVNEGIKLQNKILAEGLKGNEAEKIRKEIRSKIPDMDILNNEVQDAKANLDKNIALMEHYHFMRNLWFTLGTICIIGGCILCFVGFKEWIRRS
jgi:hypothetical protein